MFTSDLVVPDKFFSRLATLLESAGGPHFYCQLIELMASMIDCDRWLVIRYPRYAPPEFIVNNAMSEEAVEYYHAGLYQVDPLVHITRSLEKDSIIVLSRLESSDTYDTYIEKIFDSAEILDEIAVALSIPGKACVVLTLDRPSKLFCDEEIALINAMLPFVSELHSNHINRFFSRAAYGTDDVFGSEARDAFMVVDKNKAEVVASEPWRRAQNHYAINIKNILDQQEQSGALNLEGGKVLHWEQLPGSFAVAPGGSLLTIEAEGGVTPREGFESMLDRFAVKYDITPREKDIVRYVLKGYPNSLIAGKLSISSGTVRNHRHRLYYKLDITTERELFSMFLDQVMMV